MINKPIVAMLILWAFLLPAATLATESVVSEKAAVVTEDALRSELSAEEMATIVTEGALPSECLATVLLNKIDGVEQFVPGRGFLIEPGIHTVNGQAILDVTKCQNSNGDLEISKTADLEVNFEAGKTYYIAYDRSAPSPQEWNLLVWKVEDPLITMQYTDSPEKQYEQ